MGILRTDKISGLETPTSVTGSVYFDGTGDYLATEVSNDFALGTNNFTFEMWVYYDNKNNGDTPAVLDSTTTTYAPLIGYIENDASTNGHAVVYISANGSSWGIASNKTFGFINEKQWYHLAISRSGSNFYLFKDGQLTDSFTSSSAIHQGANQIGFGRIQTNTYFDGYVSNARLVKGTALYTSNFTVPVHALEVIGDTVLLCCNNSDSAGAASYAGIGISKTITVNGNAAASTVSPGLTRDFTSGTEFSGVTVFDTQGYFVPPSGTTEQRGRGRGLFGGGNSPGRTNSIDYIQIQTQGNAQDFGDLTLAREALAAAASATRGLFGGGDPGTNVINFVTIASTGDAVDFGDLTAAVQDGGGAANNTRGLFLGGSPSPHYNVIEYVTIASLGNAQDFGDLTRDEYDQRGCGSPTRCIIFIKDRNIDFVTFATTGNGTDFGDTIAENANISACSDSTRGIRMGGGPTNEYITIATLGNSQNFGSLTASSSEGQAVSDSKRGVISLGDNGSRTNAMDYITIQTTGNAQDFGDLTAPRDNGASSSDSHGGIS